MAIGFPQAAFAPRDLTPEEAESAATAQLKPASTFEQAARMTGGGDVETAESGKALEKARYQEQIARLRGLIGQADERFAPARAGQEAAVAALQQRTASLAGGPAVQAVQAQREAAVAAASPQAILGGQIGSTQGRAIMGLEAEAAARQAAYLRGVQALGAGLASEAEQRRAAEAEALQDLQTRYAAAQRYAAGELERQTGQQYGLYGAGLQFGGAVLGSAAGRGGGGKP